MNFVSGQGFPIKSKIDVVKFLKDNNGNEFITTIPFSKSNEWWIENEKESLNTISKIGKCHFSTIVYNSPIKQKTKEHLIYVDWELQHNGHPKH